MTFKVKDLMVGVSGLFDNTEPSTCPTATKPTGGITCADSIFDHAGGAHELSVLKDQLRQVMMRA